MLDTMEVLISAYTVTLSSALGISAALYTIRDKTKDSSFGWFFPHGTLAGIFSAIPFSLPILVQVPHAIGYKPLDDIVLESYYDVALATVQISKDLGLNKSGITVEICGDEDPFNSCDNNYVGSVYKNLAGIYVVSLNQDNNGNSTYVMRHELAHIANGDCDERFEEIISFDSLNILAINYFSILKEELWQDPIADLYALYGIKFT